MTDKKDIRVHRILRENKDSPLAYVPSNLGDKVSQKVIRGSYTKREIDPTEALPINRVAVTPKGAYKYGDGDTLPAPRPGSLDPGPQGPRG